MVSHSALFAYGTLQIPKVFERVTGRVQPGIPARLEGYRRYPLKGLSYPAILPESGASVEGLVYSDLDAAIWARLDAFEDSFYLRIPVEVSVSSGERLRAQTYGLRPDSRNRIRAGVWSLDTMAPADLDALLERLAPFRSDDAG